MNPGSLDAAIVLATTYHAGQVDKVGQPYILHPLRVMLAQTTEEARIVAVLHDTLEDTDLTVMGLHSSGFSERVILAVQAMTRGNTEPWREYINRISQNPIAIRVKLADLNDNLRPIPNPTKVDAARTQRYQNTIHILTEL